MSTSGSLLPVVLRGARPGELPVVRWPRPIVPSSQLVDHRALTTTRSTRLLQPWRTRSQKPYRRRPVSTPLAFGASSGRFSGRRLAVKRWALGPAGRPSGDSGAGHPLAGGYVGHGARRGGDGDSCAWP